MKNDPRPIHTTEEELRLSAFYVCLYQHLAGGLDIALREHYAPDGSGSPISPQPHELRGAVAIARLRQLADILESSLEINPVGSEQARPVLAWGSPRLKSYGPLERRPHEEQPKKTPGEGLAFYPNK